MRVQLFCNEKAEILSWLQCLFSPSSVTSEMPKVVESAANDRQYFRLVVYKISLANFHEE